MVDDKARLATECVFVSIAARLVGQACFRVAESIVNGATTIFRVASGLSSRLARVDFVRARVGFAGRPEVVVGDLGAGRSVRA